MRPWLKYGAIGVLWFLGITLALAWFLTTPSGTRWLLGAISRGSPVKVEVKRITGRLTDALVMEGVEIVWPEGRMEIDQLAFRWLPANVLAGKITLSNLDVGDVQIRDNRPETNIPLDLTLPRVRGLPAGLPVEIRSLHLKRLFYRRLSQAPLSAENLSAHLFFHHRTVEVVQFSFDSPIGRGEAKGELNLSRPALNLDLSYAPKEVVLGLDHFSVHLNLIPGLGSEQLAGTLSLAGRLASADRINLKGELGLTSNQMKMRRFLLSQPGRTGTVAFDGEVSFPSKEPLARLHLKLKDLDLSKELLLRTKLSGDLLVGGTPWNYRGQFEVENSGEAWREARFSGIFQGNLDGIDVTRMDGALLSGGLKGEFQASWSKGMSLLARIQGRDLNPMKITPDWPGKINLDLEGYLRSSASIPVEGKLEASLLGSHLRGKALTGRIDAQLHQGILRLKKADLHGKGFNFSAQGVLEERLDFEARISDLAGLIPGTQGSLNAKGWARWREHQWAGAVAGQGKDILIDLIRMGGLDVTARMNEEGKASVDLKASVKNLVFDSFPTESVSLKVSGRVNQHRIEVRAFRPDGDVQGLLVGAYGKEKWEGTIAELSGNYPKGRPWSLSAPASLSLTARTFKMTPFLITSRTGEVFQFRADLAFKPILGFVEAEWENFDVGHINPWLRRPRLSGKTTGRLRNQWLGEDRIRLNAAFNMAGAIQDASLNLERIRGRVIVDWDEKGLEASYQAELAEAGTFRGQLSSPQPGRIGLPEQGRFDIFGEAIDLDLLKHWFPQDLIVEGQASGRLSGQWSKGWQWNSVGEINVTQGAMRWRTQGGLVRSSLQRADLNWSWRENDLEGKFSLALSEYGEVKGRLRLPLAARFPLVIPKTGPIELSLHGQVEEKGLLPILFPKVIRESWGGLDLILDARGTWEKPHLVGRVQFKKAGMRLLKGPSSSQGGDPSSKSSPEQKKSEPLKLELLRGRAEMDWSEEGLRASYEMELSEGGNLKGRLSSTQPARFSFPETGTFSASLEGIDLDPLRPWLPSALRLNGHLSGKVEGEWMADRRLKMKGEGKILPGNLGWKTEDGQIDAKFKTADVHFNWHGEELTGDLSVALENYGQARGNFRLPLPASFPLGFRAQGPIEVVLQGRMEEKGLLTALFPDLIQESHGQLDLNLVTRGTWENPRSEGVLKLAGAGAYLPASGVRLKDFGFEARFMNDQIQITSFRVDSGPGHIEGNARASMKDWRISRLQGTLWGDRFQTIYLPELQVLCTPRLDFDGTLEKLRVQGEIRLPEFSILGRQTKGGLRPSPDVVIVDPKELPKSTPVFPLDAEVRILLGDKVFVKTEGIDARLMGGMTLRMEPSKAMMASGEIQVAQGNYNIYGQKLDVIRGRLLFGGPIDNPSLDILALRKVKGTTRWEEQIREVQAGVVVTGNIRSPLIRLYSQPPMPEKDVLSYIILGQPVSNSGDKDQMATLLNAARALFSAGESALLQNQLSSQLGIDALDIRTTTLGNAGGTVSGGSGTVSRSLVTVGKYLDPRLYVGVGGSPFAKSYQIIFRYGLTRKIEVETKAGTESGANLYYKIEFD